MREILFRGKAIYDGEWLEGDLFHRGDEVCINNFHKGFNIVVIPETVGQYTGLNDNNGKRIFEGDIVKLQFLYWGGLAVIRCFGAGFRAVSDYHVYQISESMEVVGNIHDNPELLEGM